MFRKLISMTLLTATMSLSFTVFGQESGQKLETVTVEAVPIKQYIYLDGLVEAVQQATLFAQTSGRVIKLSYDIDDFVKKGSVIAVLRDTEQKARVNQAKAGLDAAKAQAKEAELEFNRVADLFEKKLVAASLKDRADSALKSANAQLSAASARFDEANEQLAHTVIKAPFSGTLTKRHIEVGETLQVGQAVVSGVAQQDALRFNVQVPQRLIEKVRKLTTIDIILDDGHRLSSDQITIFPTADTASHSFELRAQIFSNDLHLHPGMFVKVGLQTGVKNQITVPDKSIVHRSELSAVYVLTDTNRIQLRQVRVGRADNGHQIILSGLEAGEKVLLQPNQASIAIKTQLQGE